MFELNEIQLNAALWLARALLLAALVLACVIDQRERRIPNWLSVGLLSIGLLWNSLGPVGASLFDDAYAGAIGLRSALIGATLVFVVFIPMYALRLFGAGDVKLLTAVGAWLGPWQAVSLMLMVLLCGGALSVARMTNARRRAVTITNLQTIALQTMAGAGGAQLFDPKSDTADRMPYAWAILAGALVYALAKSQAWWNWL